MVSALTRTGSASGKTDPLGHKGMRRASVRGRPSCFSFGVLANELVVAAGRQNR